MNDLPYKSSPPPGEAWWERELHRNQKLMDRYMRVFEDEGEAAFEKYDTPDKLFNKVHYGIEPGEPLPPEALAREAGRDPAFEEWKDEVLNAAAAAAEEVEDALDPEKPDATEEAGGPAPASEWEADEDDAEWDEDDGATSAEDEAAYQPVAQLARRFAVRVFRQGKQPGFEEVLLLSAGKVGANLAGGHGLGYDEKTLCGNIVKCRWALADCEVCRELLEPLAQRSGDPVLAELVAESEHLAVAIRERIAMLRARVWW
jgi:hypothetical protein